MIKKFNKIVNNLIQDLKSSVDRGEYSLASCYATQLYKLLDLISKIGEEIFIYDPINENIKRVIFLGLRKRSRCLLVTKEDDLSITDYHIDYYLPEWYIERLYRKLEGKRK
ncbi:MAG: hypothetical protein DRI61_00835 [Chloroflexi bacterium]|nr:MAG: hypothetical protein DRI61_00835 [Chloroflexota bacterium]